MEIKWIKMSTDLFNNRKIKQIERMQDGDAIIVIWLKLLVLAAEINDGGDVYFLKSVPFSEESLAVEFGRSVEIIALALRTFEAYGMIEIKDHAITIINWEKYQSVDKMEELREYNRLAQQRSREKKRAQMESQICQYCGGKATGYDHIIPRSKGGSDDDWNKVPCCPRCNSSKGTMSLERFLNGNRSFVDVDIVTQNSKLLKFVYYDGTRFHSVNDSQIDSQAKCQPRIDKKRIDKNRLDKKGDMGETISKALLKTWQSNLDAEEANKEIRQ